MRRLSLGVLVLALLTPLSASMPAFPLTVDSIMRGPALVGYPPSGLRWSGDSTRLYSEWRGRDDEETATWVVNRDCAAAGAALPAACAPRKLSDDERKLAPPPSGTWDAGRRRILAVQQGDVVLIDTVANTRTALTRTVVGESSPRWTADETAVTFVRENSLYRVALGTAGDGLEQLTDAGPPRRDPPLTDSQKFLKTEEQQLLAFVKEAEDKRKKAEAKRAKEALAKLELAERQTAPDLQLAHDGRFVYATVVERAQNARRSDVPTYVTTSAYAEQIPTRTKVGDAQDRRRLAVLNLATKRQVWAALPASAMPSPEAPTASASMVQSAPVSPSPAAAVSAPGSPGSPASESAAGKPDPARDLRWTMPVVSRDGSHAVATVVSADNEQRWIVLVDPETGSTRISRTLSMARRGSRRPRRWTRSAHPQVVREHVEALRVHRAP